MPNAKVRIIVADPDRFLRESISLGLGPSFEAIHAGKCDEVLDIFRSQPIDVILADCDPTGSDGVRICTEVRKLVGGKMMPIYLTGEDDENMPRKAFEAGATDYLLRPVHLGLLSRRILHDLRVVERLTANLATPLQKAQAESELFKIIPKPAALIDGHGILLTVNEAFERMYANRAMCVGRPVAELLNGIGLDSFEKETIVFADLTSTGRGRVPVRITRTAINEGPWHGCSVFFIVERAASDASSTPTLPESERANVIVLEDYDVVARSLRRLLEKAGHRVSVAASAEEAVAQFRSAMERRDPFDLAILDIAVPGSMGGVEVIKSLRGLSEHVAAIVTSGAWNDPAMSKPHDFGFDAALKKPFNRDELMAVTNRVLAKYRR